MVLQLLRIKPTPVIDSAFFAANKKKAVEFQSGFYNHTYKDDIPRSANETLKDDELIAFRTDL